MSALPRKRTFVGMSAMSAKCQKQTFAKAKHSAALGPSAWQRSRTWCWQICKLYCRRTFEFLAELQALQERRSLVPLGEARLGRICVPHFPEPYPRSADGRSGCGPRAAEPFIGWPATPARAAMLASFREGMQQLGYVEGSNVRFEF